VVAISLRQASVEGSGPPELGAPVRGASRRRGARGSAAAAPSAVLGEGLLGGDAILLGLEALEPGRERIGQDVPDAPIGARSLDLHGPIELRIEIDGDLHVPSIPASKHTSEMP
jgi:hypothetical protein